MFFFNDQRERQWLRQQPLPQHIAIIMDGNGTWAKRRGLPRNAGHARGAESLRRALSECLAASASVGNSAPKARAAAAANPNAIPRVMTKLLMD